MPKNTQSSPLTAKRSLEPRRLQMNVRCRFLRGREENSTPGSCLSAAEIPVLRFAAFLWFPPPRPQTLCSRCSASNVTAQAEIHGTDPFSFKGSAPAGDQRS